MIKCIKCGNEIDRDNVKFCPECGAELAKQKKKYCMNCGALIEGGKFCPECGTSVDAEIFEQEPTNMDFNFSVLNTIASNQLFDKEGFTVENGVLLKYQGNRRSVVIPGLIEEIYDNVFADNNIISILTIEEGLKVIGKRAFANCSSLTKVYIPASCDLIYEDVFENTHLKELVLGNYDEDIIKYCLSPLAFSYLQNNVEAKRFVETTSKGSLIKIAELEKEALRIENERL